MPSLMRIGYLLLRPTSCASESATGGELTTPIAAFRCSPSGVSSCQSVRIMFTNTRVPSLLIAVESDRLMSARIWRSPVRSASWPSDDSVRS